MEEKKSVRVQFDFSTEAHERLCNLQEKTDAKTKAEVVRNALRLYEWFVAQKKEELRIQLVKDDEIVEVELLF